ncbi:MAG: EamA family transporter [Bacteroidales bacterium]|jgi:drug/metabolite transporter (DMT)-like permease|nr:EamA family transporter [Bacteroidales bacterium]MDD2205090.1 EamA family transporter [Bacteroidales bacterium]MDD3152552.1 EamA family transporter [Bacteroidales bacterium]MDD3914572.1 EamA family transporter [Bacteroidales bacterium]MDD4634483.1 EamA family transporter [Bacteroidales bacterium]
MISLIIAILTSTAILLTFKIAAKKNVSTLQSITFSYLTSAILGFIFSSEGSTINYIIQSNWFGWSILYGFFFICGFIVFGICTTKCGISITAISSRISAVIPILFGIFLFNDTLNNPMIIGLLLALISLVLINLPDKKIDKTTDKRSKLLTWLPILIFFIIGINDTIIKLAQAYLINNNDYSEFICSCFLFSGVIGLIFMFINKEYKITLKSVITGITLGIFNYLNFKSLLIGLGQIQVSVFIPVYSICVVILSVLIGYFIFKEKISKTNLIGIITAILAILLLTIKI